MNTTITFRLSTELAETLGLPVDRAGCCTTGLVSLAGLLAARCRLPVSVNSLARQHAVTRLASAAAWGVLERPSAAALAFELGAFLEVDRPADLPRERALVWLAAVFQVYFEIRYDAGQMENADGKEARGWARMLLDSEVRGLGSLPDPRVRTSPEGPGWTIGLTAMHRLIAGRPPDVYPEDLVPILTVSPAQLAIARSIPAIEADDPWSAAGLEEAALERAALPVPHKEEPCISN